MIIEHAHLIEDENVENVSDDNVEHLSTALTSVEKEALAKAQQEFISKVSAEFVQVDLGPVAPLSVDLFNRIKALVGDMSVDLEDRLDEDEVLPAAPPSPKRSLH